MYLRETLSVPKTHGQELCLDLEITRLLNSSAHPKLSKMDKMVQSGYFSDPPK